MYKLFKYISPLDRAWNRVTRWSVVGPNKLMETPVTIRIEHLTRSWLLLRRIVTPSKAAEIDRQRDATQETHGLAQ